MSLRIVPLPTRAKNVRSPPLMEQVKLEHPFSLAVFGMTGSGKTVAVLNLLTNPSMYGNYFDETWLFSVTGAADDSFGVLKLDKKRIITDANKMVSSLQKLLKKQKTEVEKKGIDKAKKVCIVFEDLTANKKLMRSKAFLECFVQNRHHGVTTIACCHKYHALIRTARLNCNHVWIFPCTRSEQNRLIGEAQPPQLISKQFEELIAYAFAPTADQPRPFLWINYKVPTTIRFRKSFQEILQI